MYVHTKRNKEGIRGKRNRSHAINPSSNGSDSLDLAIRTLQDGRSRKNVIKSSDDFSWCRSALAAFDAFSRCERRNKMAASGDVTGNERTAARGNGSSCYCCCHCRFLLCAIQHHLPVDFVRPFFLSFFLTSLVHFQLAQSL